jgi:hypothetical protein
MPNFKIQNFSKCPYIKIVLFFPDGTQNDSASTYRRPTLRASFMGKKANDASALGASLPDYSASRKWAQPRGKRQACWHESPDGDSMGKALSL